MALSLSSTSFSSPDILTPVDSIRRSTLLGSTRSDAEEGAFINAETISRAAAAAQQRLKVAELEWIANPANFLGKQVVHFGDSIKLFKDEQGKMHHRLDHKLTVLGERYLVFNEGKILGEGVFKKGLNAIDLRSGERFAALTNKELGNSAAIESIRAEAGFLEELKECPSVVKFKNLFEEEGRSYLIEELCSENELFDVLVTQKLDVRAQLSFSLKVAKAVQEIHAKNVAHLDLKPENFFLTLDGFDFKLGDFGFSTHIDSPHKNHPGSLRYSAPEIFDVTPLSTRSHADVWSVASIVHIIMTDSPLPWLKGKAAMYEGHKLMCWVRDQYSKQEGGFEPAIRNYPELNGILRRCFRINPDERPSIDEVCEVLERLV